MTGLLLVFGGAVAAGSHTTPTAPVPAAQVAVAPAPDKPALDKVEAAPASKSAPIGGGELAAAQTQQRLSDRQRRMLILLWMNSAGPVSPYGGLGR